MRGSGRAKKEAIADQTTIRDLVRRADLVPPQDLLKQLQIETAHLQIALIEAGPERTRRLVTILALGQRTLTEVLGIPFEPDTLV